MLAAARPGTEKDRPQVVVRARAPRFEGFDFSKRPEEKKMEAPGKSKLVAEGTSFGRLQKRLTELRPKKSAQK